MPVDTIQFNSTANFVRDTISAFIRHGKQGHATDNFDWRTLQGIVKSRNLGSLFSYCHEKHSLPSPVRMEWQQMRMASSLQNMAKLKVTTDINKIAEGAGIGAVAMRGIVLAHSLYPDPALRPMHDVDILIRPVDRKAFLAAMKKAGHAPTDYFRSQYVYSISNVTVEVHWELLSNKRYRDRMDSDELVSSAIRVDTRNGSYYRLAGRWELIGLVVHAFTHHNLSQIFSLIDIGLFMHHKEIDWPDIVIQCEKMGISRMMHLTLGFVDELFNLGFDGKILEQFSPGKKMAKRFYRAYMEQILHRITLPTHCSIKRSQFYVAESAGNKGREFLRLFSRKELRFLAGLIAGAFSTKKQKLKA